jgi:hypothetical protein
MFGNCQTTLISTKKIVNIKLFFELITSIKITRKKGKRGKGRGLKGGKKQRL